MMFAMFGYENWEDLNFEESWLLVVFSLLGFFFFFLSSLYCFEKWYGRVSYRYGRYRKHQVN